MCELLGMSNAVPLEVGFSLERLAAHGGLLGPHRDGWGLASYEGPDVRLTRLPEPAADSPLLHCMQQQRPAVTLAVSHIRRRLRGDNVLANTQPFARPLHGCWHCFAHNGDLPALLESPPPAEPWLRPVGDTDSERAFLALLGRMAALPAPTTGGTVDPGRLPERIALIRELAAAWREMGPANFLYSDGVWMYAHAHVRLQADGRLGPPGLWLLDRNTPGLRPFRASGVDSRGRAGAQVLLASVPLTDEYWEPLAEGELVVARAGRVVARVAP